MNGGHDAITVAWITAMHDTVRSVIWAAVVVYAARLAAAAVVPWHPVATPAALPDPVDVPDDLVALAMAQSEPWAQEDMVKAMRERYEQYGDWDRVRSAFGIGHLPMTE